MVEYQLRSRILDAKIDQAVEKFIWGRGENRYRARNLPPLIRGEAGIEASQADNQRNGVGEAINVREAVDVSDHLGKRGHRI
ncbi:hypothetical protein L2E82_22186 [Cichorium intybus]|uniref:Uncharacterized protein n=1 Tax=Cichorium intybus TaxID=13427 RepID=A0ACB9DX63_CICIN|nr:hypothetical protein L2E82_22186 [Cichorium intybus]